MQVVRNPVTRSQEDLGSVLCTEVGYVEGRFSGFIQYLHSCLPPVGYMLLFDIVQV
jgi:hypothetical protein